MCWALAHRKECNMKIVIISGGRLDTKSVPALFKKNGMNIKKRGNSSQSSLLSTSSMGISTERQGDTTGDSEAGVVIISVDGGLEYCKLCGIQPDYLVGDFDTIADDILQEYAANPWIQVKRYDPQKDLTDTDAAVNLAIELIQNNKEPENMVYLLGGIGSRMDHTMANIGCLKKTMQAGIPMKIMDEHNCIYGFSQSFRLYREQLVYQEYLSLLALEQVEGLTIKGMKYETDHITLSVLESRGVSNQLEQEEAEVEFTSGVVLVVESRD